MNVLELSLVLDAVCCSPSSAPASGSRWRWRCADSPPCLTKVATPAGQVLATSMWTASNSWDLTALPMFIWMGEILYRTKLSDDMFEGLAPWLQKLPGRLLHVNVVGCAIFAAVSGLVGRDLRHHRPHRAAGTPQARLRRTHGRSARLPDPARSDC